jgi:hypothetical protein
VFSEYGRSIGLLIDEILDIAEERLDIKMAAIDLAYSAMRSLEATSPKSSTSDFFWQPEARSAARHER